jgi:glutamine amidotransferase-like uncharacterized protein
MFRVLIIIFLLMSLPSTLLAKTVYVYDGEGAGEESKRQAYNSLANILEGKYKVEYLGTAKLLKGEWVDDAAAIIMPGGADLPYARFLNGKGNELIKNFVVKGGSYIGFCAGAYYGSSYLEFAMGTPIEVFGSRELSFFRGKAIGPWGGKYYYTSYSTATVEKLWSTKEQYYAFVIGGPYFKDANQHPDTNVLAWYDVKKEFPAILAMGRLCFLGHIRNFRQIIYLMLINI